MKLLTQLLLNGMATGAVYAMLAVGFGLVYRSTRVFHIAYGALYVSSTYLLFTAHRILALPLSISVIITILGTAGLGLLLEKLVYVHFWERRASEGVVLIASLGVFVVIENAIVLGFGNELKVISTGLEPAVRFSGLMLKKIQLVGIAVAGGSTLGIWLLLRSWPTARALWAMGDEPALIPVLGLPVRQLRSLAFLMSSTMLAFPACLISLEEGLDPRAGMRYLLVAAVAVFFGGVDRFIGWVTGGVGLALLQTLAIWRFSARWIDLVTFGLLLSVLLLRPQGLWGRSYRVEELAG